MIPPFSRFRLLLCAVALLSLTACSETELASHYAKKVTWPGQQSAAGTYKVGNPYQVDGTWYYPQENYNYSETGIASWYGPDFHGKHTANGELYDQNELTAAHRTLPMPSLVRVTNLQNGRSVVVRINDRGPFKRGRIIDVSKRAADLLGFIGNGTAQVRVEAMAQESRQIADAARRGVDTSRLTMNDLSRTNPDVGAVSTPSGSTAVQRMEVASAGGVQMPDSLKTPTITVEELNAPRPAIMPTAPVMGHIEQGHFLPDPVVTTMPVAATGIFVQAGAFGVKDNADRMAASLKSIGPVITQSVNVNGRQLWRVKVGPLASVDAADRVLARVVSAGGGGAKVVHD